MSKTGGKSSQKKIPRVRSRCQISSFLDILGDKWTLLVIRDLFIGLNKFSDFRNSPEKIPSNLLSERLKRLESKGIVSKSCYQEHPKRYHYQLTEQGKALWPVLKEMIQWSNTFIPGLYAEDEIKQIAKERFSTSQLSE